MIDKRIRRLQRISKILFDTANSYAGDETGVVAARLHEASGKISYCLRMLDDGINSADKLSLMQDWLRDKPSMSPAVKEELAIRLAPQL